MLVLYHRRRHLGAPQAFASIATLGNYADNLISLGLMTHLFAWDDAHQQLNIIEALQ